MTFKRASLVPLIAGGLLVLGSACMEQPPTEGGGAAGAGAAGSGEGRWGFPGLPGRPGNGNEAGRGAAGSNSPRREFPWLPRLPGAGGRGGSVAAGGSGGTRGHEKDADAGLQTQTTEGAQTDTGSVVIGR